ncbi:carbamoyltransferase C-terminal domain-containing protein [Streptomyces mirabilis]|nr:carbamoyltransferase C-terminal domain-containing protein [Streptomyces mirabilis]
MTSTFETRPGSTGSGCPHRPRFHLVRPQRARPFMLSARPVGPDHADKSAGVLHVDGTARVQTVDPATAPAYGVLIEHFHQFTGLPLVLNTSYNNREPLVQTPAHTLATLQACDLDAACIGPSRPATLNGMTTSTPPLREAARAVVLNADLRVLLLRYDENGGFWATPGGSLEEGEHPRAATRRELHEELGIDEKTVELGVQLAERSKDHLVGGREVRQIERYFLAYVDPADVDPADVDPARATQPDNISGVPVVDPGPTPFHHRSGVPAGTRRPGCCCR